MTSADTTESRSSRREHEPNCAALTVPLSPLSEPYARPNGSSRRRSAFWAEANAASTRDEMEGLVAALGRGALDEAEFERGEDDLLRRLVKQHRK